MGHAVHVLQRAPLCTVQPLPRQYVLAARLFVLLRGRRVVEGMHCVTRAHLPVGRYLSSFELLQTMVSRF